MFMKLHELCKLVKSHHLAIHTDSRKVEKGNIFVALPLALSSHLGKRFPPFTYIQNALDNGATYIVLEKTQYEAFNKQGDINEDTSYIIVENARKSLGILAQAKYDTAQIPFPIIAITGTNGKTTSAYLLEHIYHMCGKNVAIIGTVSYRWDGHYEPAPLTTPDCLHLHEALANMKAANVDVLIMEVSSHALDQDRIAGIEFDALIFTNLTQDHLDYHENMENYFQAKKHLFTSTPKESKVMSVYGADSFGQRILEECPKAEGFYLTISKNDHHNHLFKSKIQHTPLSENIKNPILHGTLLKNATDGLTIAHEYKGKTWQLHSPLVGEHNAFNVLGVELLALQLGFEVQDLMHLETFNGVPGRLERTSAHTKISSKNPYLTEEYETLPEWNSFAPSLHDSVITADNQALQNMEITATAGTSTTSQKQTKYVINPEAHKASFFVDYAHTPDALVQAQEALRTAGFARIITVFGCGGDRDKTKRPLMGQAVAQASDIVILTSDNPRTEEPESILDDIMPGLEGAKEVYRIIDRRDALALAVSLAQEGDAILVAGKGHETYQIIGTKKYHFSDQEILQNLLLQN